MVGYPEMRDDARAAGRLGRHGLRTLWDAFLWVFLAVMIASVVIPAVGLIWVIAT